LSSDTHGEHHAVGNNQVIALYVAWELGGPHGGVVCRCLSTDAFQVLREVVAIGHVHVAGIAIVGRHGGIIARLLQAAGAHFATAGASQYKAIGEHDWFNAELAGGEAPGSSVELRKKKLSCFAPNIFKRLLNDADRGAERAG
jgi:hypothetical protein